MLNMNSIISAIFEDSFKKRFENYQLITLINKKRVEKDKDTDFEICGDNFEPSFIVDVNKYNESTVNYIEYIASNEKEEIKFSLKFEISNNADYIHDIQVHIFNKDKLIYDKKEIAWVLYSIDFDKDYSSEINITNKVNATEFELEIITFLNLFYKVIGEYQKFYNNLIDLKNGKYDYITDNKPIIEI